MKQGIFFFIITKTFFLLPGGCAGEGGPTRDRPLQDANLVGAAEQAEAEQTIKGSQATLTPGTGGPGVSSAAPVGQKPPLADGHLPCTNPIVGGTGGLGVNLRSTPSPQGAVVTPLNEGTQLKSEGVATAGYAPVSYQSFKGFVPSKFLRCPSAVAGPPTPGTPSSPPGVTPTPPGPTPPGPTQPPVTPQPPPGPRVQNCTVNIGGLEALAFWKKVDCTLNGAAVLYLERGSKNGFFLNVVSNGNSKFRQLASQPQCFVDVKYITQCDPA